MLNERIDGNGRAGDDDRMLQAANLLGAAQRGGCEERDRYVAEKAVGALQALVRAELAKPEGFSSYLELQAWIAEQFGVRMNYAALYHMARYRMGAKLKVPRPTNPKKKLPR